MRLTAWRSALVVDCTSDTTAMFEKLLPGLRALQAPAFVLLLFGVCPRAEDAAEGPVLTQGVASGDVTASSAILWARAGGLSTLETEYDTDERFARPKKGPSVRVTGASDFTGQIALTGLRAATRYFYRIRARNGADSSRALTGSFVTAPRPGESRDLRFVWGGDLGGQGFCRKPDEGYVLFEVMTRLQPDFALFSGDMIYADSPCPAPPNVSGADFVAATLPEFRQRWRYNREDLHHRMFLASTSMVTQWDDHEVVNDFAGPFEPLMPPGLQAFFEYHPIARSPEEKYRMYRKLRWGKMLELIVLDNRQYRAANSQPDGPEKSMLGSRQYGWLIRSLSSSDAVWKVVASSVPLTVPTGGASEKRGRDGWANGSTAGRPEGDSTGWERELMSIFTVVRDRKIRNVLWITTDVHFAQFARLDPFGDGSVISHELISGPLSAVAVKPAQLDTTLNPTRIYAEGGFFNFGAVAIDARTGRFTAEIRALDAAGGSMTRHALVLEAEAAQ